MSRNQLKTIAVEDIQDIETRKQATFRLWKIKCYNCCNITSVLKIASLIVVPALFPIAFCVPGINEALKWTLVGLASLAGAFLFYASVFSLALSPMFGCDMKYSCCTFCQPRDTTFDSDYKQYLDLEAISLVDPKPALVAQLNPAPQPNYSDSLPVQASAFAPVRETVLI